MPRTSEQNKKIREEAKEKILNAALGLYVKLGYNGTDMDSVAACAEVAKGLLYYYFKTKNALFRELFSMMMDKITSVSEMFFEKNSDLEPVEKLILYSADIYGLGLTNPEYIQFSMRMPFDAYAVFGPDGWPEGLKGSKLHMENLEKIIKEGIDCGQMTYGDAASGAGAYWVVFVSGLFNFTKMIGKTGSHNSTGNIKNLEKLISFGMNGLGVGESIWKDALNKHRKELNNESL